MNYLSITCDGSKIATANRSDDAQQLKLGLDMNNYKAQIFGNITVDSIDSYSTIEIEGLETGITYVAFFGLEAEIDGKAAFSLKNETKQMTFTAPRK